jgi:hypothetical protein
LRLQAYQQFRAVHELIESARFEAGAEFRRKLEAINSAAQRLLLYLLAVIQHRPDLRPDGLPESLRVASLRFRTALSNELEVLAARVIGRDYRQDEDLQRALVEVEQSVASQSGSITDPALTAQIHARLELYQESVPVVLQLVRLRIEE